MRDVDYASHIISECPASVIAYTLKYHDTTLAGNVKDPDGTEVFFKNGELESEGYCAKWRDGTLWFLDNEYNKENFILIRSKQWFIGARMVVDGREKLKIR